MHARAYNVLLAHEESWAVTCASSRGERVHALRATLHRVHNRRVLQEKLDRRAALKARHRAAIVGAARELIAEHGVSALSADQLAARADVARRTLFNHFSSLDEIVVACLEAELHTALASVEDAAGAPDGPSATSTPLDDLEALLHAPDLAGAVVRIARLVDGPGDTTRAERVQQEAVRHATAPLLARLRARHPDLTALDAALVTTTVMNGMAVVAGAWLEETGGRLDAASRLRWDHLLDHLFTTLRRGFPAPQAHPLTDSPKGA